MRKEIEQSVAHLKNHHKKELNPIVKKCLDIIVDEKNKRQIVPNASPRGLGFEVRPHQPTPHVQGVYQTWVEEIAFYTGEGYLDTRLSRLSQGFMGEECPTSSHTAGIWLRKHTENNIVRTRHLFFSYVTWQEEIKSMIEELELEYNSAFDGIVDTKKYLRDICLHISEPTSKPYTTYIEYQIMNILGSIGNTMGIENKALVAQNIQSFYTKDYAINNKNQWAA
tara:strand:+ start:60 stop:731 length:672 start_codon:yes stop_codon:yes gene_type:complete